MGYTIVAIAGEDIKKGQACEIGEGGKMVPINMKPELPLEEWLAEVDAATKRMYPPTQNSHAPDQDSTNS